MASYKFKIGDVVALNSGSKAMTILRLDVYAGTPGYICLYWHEDSKNIVQSPFIAEACLILASEATKK